MTTDLQDTTLYWELLDALPPNAEADGYVEFWFRTHSPTSDILTAQEHASFHDGYREWATKVHSEERSTNRVDQCRERLDTAFNCEKYDSDLVRDVMDLFEEEDDHGENLIACLVQFLLDAADGDTFVKSCLQKFKTLRNQVSAPWLVQIGSHANQQGVSAWSNMQLLKGDRREHLRDILNPSPPHPTDKYTDAERRLSEWYETLRGQKPKNQKTKNTWHDFDSRFSILDSQT